MRFSWPMSRIIPARRRLAGIPARDTFFLACDLLTEITRAEGYLVL
jgi:hypothetical protein